MSKPRPTITSWRAFVSGEQIGFRYHTQMDAHEAARMHIEERFDTSTQIPNVVIRPSYAPIEISRQNPTTGTLLRD